MRSLCPWVCSWGKCSALGRRMPKDFGGRQGATKAIHCLKQGIPPTSMLVTQLGVKSDFKVQF